MNLSARVASVLLSISVTAQAAPPTAPIPALKPVNIDVDVSRLPASERAALVKILRAAQLIDTLYIRQVWPGTQAFLQRQSAQGGVAKGERDALAFFKGPWGPGGAAFIADVPAQRPIGDFYPPTAKKQDIETWLATLDEFDRKRALDGFTAIENDSSGSFVVVPYAKHYGQTLADVAQRLREAAALTHEQTLRSFLTLRADALMSGDYYASDVAFVGLKGALDVVMGPYEVDDDAWFGTKTAFESSVALVNDEATRRIETMSTHLQELEDHLPLPAELRGRKLAAAAPILVSDVIYHGGMAGAGTAAAGYGLPNDVRVLNAVGGRTGTYSNILKTRYDGTFLPIAKSVLLPADQASLHFENIRDEVMFVRIFDALGPQTVTGTQKPISDALRENTGVANQIRSMLLSLWGHRYLIEHGYLDSRESASLYSGFLVPALARIRSGSSGTPARGSTYLLNHLMEAGAFKIDGDGRFSIDRAASDADIVRAANEFIVPMAAGDAAKISGLLDHYVKPSAQIRDVVKRLGPAPPTERPIYRTAERLISTATKDGP